jgi:hypothetical protein
LNVSQIGRSAVAVVVAQDEAVLGDALVDVAEVDAVGFRIVDQLEELVFFPRGVLITITWKPRVDSGNTTRQCA